MARDKHDKEQQEKAPQHKFGGRAHIVAVKQCDEHRGKDKCTSEDIARTLRIL